MNTTTFDYGRAFSRNLGWLRPAEQTLLRGKRAAIPGLDGVGELHLLTLARPGVSRFHVRDFDTFHVVNFNHQIGVTAISVARSQLDVMVDLSQDLNRIGHRRFPGRSDDGVPCPSTGKGNDDAGPWQIRTGPQGLPKTGVESLGAGDALTKYQIACWD
jgi:hypothetical protein